MQYRSSQNHGNNHAKFINGYYFGSFSQLQRFMVAEPRRTGGKMGIDTCNTDLSKNGGECSENGSAQCENEPRDQITPFLFVYGKRILVVAGVWVLCGYRMTEEWR